MEYLNTLDLCESVYEINKQRTHTETSLSQHIFRVNYPTEGLFSPVNLRKKIVSVDRIAYP